MGSAPVKAKAYLKDGCPFSFKFWLFMVEARLDDQIEVIRCNEDDPAFERIKEKLSAALGKEASFPTVEVENGRYQSDSDALIRHYATKAAVDMKRLPLLAFYKDSIMPQVEELHSLKEH
jgi:spore cortex formation protein SpoVR/YcgB (stage V sporulation)